MAFFSFLLLAQPSQAETSDDFNDLDLFFYGDLDNGNGNISTMQPTSDVDTQSDCPQEANRLSWPGQDRQWTSVGSWVVDLETPGSVASGEHMFTIWANSTQGTVEDVQFRISVTIGGGTADGQATSQSKTITDSSEEATKFEISFDLTNESFNQNDQLEVETIIWRKKEYYLIEDDGKNKVFEIADDDDIGKEVGLWIDNKLVRPDKKKK